MTPEQSAEIINSLNGLQTAVALLCALCVGALFFSILAWLK